ncbi:MAG: glycosyltransferase [Clostridium baratii]
MKKNILYFTRTMGLGGTEKVVLQMCEALKDNFDNIIVCSCGGENVEKLVELGIKHYKIGDIENKNPIFMLKTIKQLKEIIDNEKINIVHTQHRMAAFYSRILKGKYKFTFIHTAHNTFFDKKIITKYSLGKSNLIAVGNKVKSNLINEFSIPEKNITTLYNGVRQEKCKMNKINELESARKKGYFLVGNIGRISKQKGMEYFILAAKDLIDKKKNIKFFIVGDGEDKEKIEKLIHKLGLVNDVILLGYRDDISNVISQLDLIVLSSLWEGLPLTPMEAFSVGKTVIGTSVDGTTEIIKDKFNGILIEPKNWRDISKYIDYLYNNPECREVLEKNAYKTYKDKFSYDKFVVNYKNYYNKLLGE